MQSFTYSIKWLRLLAFCVALEPLVSKATNLILNGDFEQGNVLFESDYSYDNVANNVVWPGEYALAASPSDVQYNFYPFSDHTVGSGNTMLIANGYIETGVTTLWKQTVPVEKFKQYKLSVWVANVCCTDPGGRPGEVVFFVNGKSYGQGFLVQGAWKEYALNWSSQEAQTATIELRIPTTFASGNDIAIDDITFVPLGEPSDLVAIGLSWNTTGGGLEARYRVDGGALSKATSASLFWANGAGRDNKLPGFAPITEPVTIDAGTWSSDVITFTTPERVFANPPPEATHILLILDANSELSASEEAPKQNNYASLVLFDLVAASLEWDPLNAGVEFRYEVHWPALDLDTTAELWWSNGPNLADVPKGGEPVYSATINKLNGSYGPFYVPNSVLGIPPEGATHLLLIVDPPTDGFPNGFVEEGAAESNNVYPLRNRSDIVAKSLQFFSDSGGSDPYLVYIYEVEDISLDKPLLANLYWATGPTLGESLLPIAFTDTLSHPEDLTSGLHFKEVLIKDVSQRPANASYLLLVLDRDNGISELDETNNLFPEKLVCEPPVTAGQLVDQLRLRATSYPGPYPRDFGGNLTTPDELNLAHRNMQSLIDASVREDIDPRLILAIAWQESGYGNNPQYYSQAGMNHNFWGESCNRNGNGGADCTTFGNWEQAVSFIAAKFNRNSRYVGKDTLDEIGNIWVTGSVIPPTPKLAKDAHDWITNVRIVMAQLGYPKASAFRCPNFGPKMQGAFASFGVKSPVSIYLVDPHGRRYGHNCGDGNFYREIPGVVTTEEEGQVKALWLTSFVDGNYTVVLCGIGLGSYSLESSFVHTTGLSSGNTISGEIATGELHAFQTSVSRTDPNSTVVTRLPTYSKRHSERL
ncbi:MAG: glucosaminidase domain-containing protein [Verrucomicrobiales bacterium]|nr:glucosaminidase domain-containing protein [Verrucomicrobiales bacterium]